LDEESLPWGKINEFVLLLETSQTVDELYRNAVHSIGRLIPCDVGALFFAERDSLEWVLSDAEPSYRKAFNEYYRYRFPMRIEELGTERIVDFDRFRETEYARDFILPTGSRYSLGIYGEGPVCLTVTRFRWAPRFSEIEIRILEIVHSHINSLYRLLEGTRRTGNQSPETRERRSLEVLLTPREVEILDRVLCRETAAAAARAFGLSRRTVEKHIANIYEKAGVSSRRRLFEKLGIASPKPGGIRNDTVEIAPVRRMT